MKRLLAYVLGLGVLFAPGISFAAQSDFDHDLSGYNMFTPPLADKSVAYLGQVFGTVGGVIHGTSGQIMAEVFRVFNYAMVLVAAMILIYTVVLSVVNTAHEGEFMGRNMKSAWVIFRAVFGIGVLVPKYTGYSLIQVFVMWVAVQGVGLADKAWTRVLDYLGNEGGVIHAQSQDPIKADHMVGTLNSAADLLNSQVCMYKIESVLQSNQRNAAAQLRNDPTNASLKAKAQAVPSFHPTWNTDAKTVSFGLPLTKDSPKGADTICGSYGWGKTGNQTDIYERYKRVGLEQMILDLAPVAKSIADSTTAPANPNQIAPLNNASQLQDRVIRSVLGATADYENIMQPALRGAKDVANNDWAQNLKQAREEGWITAGAYYWDLANINNKLNDAVKDYQPQNVAPIASNISDYVDVSKNDMDSALNKAKVLADIPTLTELLGVLEEKVGPAISIEDRTQLLGAIWRMKTENPNFTLNQLSDLSTQLQAATTPGAVPKNAGAFKTGDVVGTSATLGAFAVGSVVATSASPGIGALMALMSSSLLALAGLWFGAMNTPGDPIAMIQMLGRGMLGIAITMWLMGSILTGVLTAMLSIGTSATGIGYGVQNSLKIFAPVFIGFVGVLFVNGMVLSVYVPMIPFMIFTFAAIGWLISVLEAIVAAPLVAAAVTHPEGHDLLGKAEQAVMLLMGVFLRPVIMIIGFIASIVLVRVTLRIVNAGFSHAAAAANITLSGVNVFGTVGLMIVYTMIVISLINLVFNAGIVKLWETIWMWVGFHQPSSAVDGALQEIKSGFHSGAQATGDFAGGLVRGSGEGAANSMEKDKDGRWGMAKNSGDQYKKNPNAEVAGQ